MVETVTMVTSACLKDLTDIPLSWYTCLWKHHICITKVWASSPEHHSKHIPAKLCGLCCVSKIKTNKPLQKPLLGSTESEWIRYLLFPQPSERPTRAINPVLFSWATDNAPIYLPRDLSLPHFAEIYFLCKHLFCNSLCFCCQALFFTLRIND